MKAFELIKDRLEQLKEKELTTGLNYEEQIEIGRLYIAISIIKEYDQKAKESEINVWRQRYNELKEEYDLLTETK